MGGGTTIVEGIAAGRHMVGNDLNSLAAFVAKVKVTPLTVVEVDALQEWIARDIPLFGYRSRVSDLAKVLDPEKTRNLSLARARFIKKAAAVALASIVALPSKHAQDFAKCALLRVCQWALDGRRRHTPLGDFRRKLARTTEYMLSAITSLDQHVRRNGARVAIYNIDATNLPQIPAFRRKRAALVITSPPYPGVHILYHRWQVDGRRETPAPYWITGCNDGQGASFYNFGDRRQSGIDNYFSSSLRTLQAIRRVVSDGAYMVQMVAFNRPEVHLPRYLENMSLAGFVDLATSGDERIWRDVPNRKWHASLRGNTHSAREVVLVHRAD
jgi:hypothetical protein